MTKATLKKMQQICKGRVLMDELMSKHTYFKIGGPADFYVYPGNMEELVALLDLCKKNGMNVFIIGNGTNLLVSDSGFRGVVIDISKTFNHLQCNGYQIATGAGVTLTNLHRYCKDRGLAGLEPLFGIPGQVGGGVRMNAGAYGTEIFDLITYVKYLDESGMLMTTPAGDIEFGYRYTSIPNTAIVVEVGIQLEDGNPKEIETHQQKYMKRRRISQPLSLPSAGSMFKRPPGDYAGRLIEESGCKGLRIGDAMVSRKHANFIVNCGLATADNVLRLVEEIQNRVFERFQVKLEMEVLKVGFA